MNQLLSLAETTEASPMQFYTDYGRFGSLAITLPPFEGTDAEFDEEFDAVMTFMTEVMKRRKRIRARIKAEAQEATTNPEGGEQ